VRCKQGVALTGRNTTGPPSRAAPGELRCICECYRLQMPESITSLALLHYRRASNMQCSKDAVADEDDDDDDGMMIVCCRQCAKEALKDLCHWLHHGGEVAVCSTCCS